jgi:hypothetical protein
MPPPTVPPRKEARQIRETYRQSTASATLRTRDEVARFFDGMELIEPGITGVRDWAPGSARHRRPSATGASALRYRRRPGVPCGVERAAGHASLPPVIGGVVLRAHAPVAVERDRPVTYGTD